MLRTALRLDPDETGFRILQAEYPRYWLARYLHRTTENEKLRWDNRPWLVDLYKDNSPQIAIEKSSKTAISEWMIVDQLAFAIEGKSSLYILPDIPVRNRFVTTRIDGLARIVPFYRENIGIGRKAVDDKGLKTIFGAACAYVGSGGKTTFYEYNTYVVYYDEYDQLAPDAIAYADDRTLAAKRLVWRKVGNPTFEGEGIDREFSRSDAKRYFQPCPHCGHWQVLDWFSHFVRQHDDGITWSLRDQDDSQPDARALCAKCSKPMDRVAAGEWVPEFFGREVSGYHVNRLFGAPSEPDETGYCRPIIREMFDKWLDAQGNQTLLTRFYNNLLGITFKAKGTQFTEEVLDRCVAKYRIPEFMEDGETLLGCDTGGDWFITILQLVNGKERLLHAERIKKGDRDTLELRMAQFRVGCGCIDAQGDLSLTRQIVADHPELYMVQFGAGKDRFDDVIDIDEDAATVRANRTECFDSMWADHVKGLCEYPADWRMIENGEFAAHMKAPIRKYLEPTGVQPKQMGRYVWHEGSKPDHLCLARVYAHIAHLTKNRGPKVYIG